MIDPKTTAKPPQELPSHTTDPGLSSGGAAVIPPNDNHPPPPRPHDRERVRITRTRGGPWLRARLLWLLIGPGILVMLGENDGPSMLSYAATGARFGIGFFLPFVVL